MTTVFPCATMAALSILVPDMTAEDMATHAPPAFLAALAPLPAGRWLMVSENIEHHPDTREELTTSSIFEAITLAGAVSVSLASWDGVYGDLSRYQPAAGYQDLLVWSAGGCDGASSPSYFLVML